MRRERSVTARVSGSPGGSTGRGAPGAPGLGKAGGGVRQWIEKHLGRSKV
jgi:hypothetical protein